MQMILIAAAAKRMQKVKSQIRLAVKTAPISLAVAEKMQKKMRWSALIFQIKRLLIAAVRVVEKKLRKDQIAVATQIVKRESIVVMNQLRILKIKKDVAIAVPMEVQIMGNLMDAAVALGRNQKGS